jgi:Uma2 family endonuclease
MSVMFGVEPIVPQVEPWTLDDLVRLPHGFFYEIVDGSLILSPPPTVRHQLVAGRLGRQITAAAPADLVALSPIGLDVCGSFLVPDIAVVRAAAIEPDPPWLAASDATLVAEIIEPRNVAIDRIEKPYRYAEAGVPHFWRVELTGDRAPYIVRYRLGDGPSYVELGTVHAGDEETVDVGFAVTVRPADLTRRRAR